MNISNALKLVIILMSTSFLYSMDRPPKPSHTPKQIESAKKELRDAIVNYQFRKSTLQEIESLIKKYPEIINAELPGSSSGRAPTSFLTPVMLASHLPQVAHLLIRNGADVNYRNTTGITALMHQATNAGGYGLTKPVLVINLLKWGANPNLRDNHGRTALHIAINSLAGFTGTRGKTEQENVLQFIKELLKVVDVNAQDNDGQTALHAAVEKNSVEIAKELLQEGADPRIRDNNQLSVFDIPASPAMTRLLDQYRTTKKLE